MIGRPGPPLRAKLPLRGLVVLVCLLGCKSTRTGQAQNEVSTLPAALEQTLVPSNDRDWSPDVAVLPYAEFAGEGVTVRNIRNCAYLSDDDYVVRHYDRTFDLQRLESVDFIVVPFKNVPSLAHTMLSFGFAGGEHLCVSVEARLERDESYSPVRGSLAQFELMYVLADERDIIVRRTLHRATEVYLYRTVATAEQAQVLFRDVMQRVNQLHDQPEFYDSLTNNCTTNIVQHINRLRPGRIPYDLRALLPGFSDHLAYQLGLLQDAGSFEETRQRANITQLANRNAESPDFSDCIRR